MFIKRIPVLALKNTCLLLAALFATHLYANEHWFEQLKRQASDEALYRFLHAMPKGGDLHHHGSGSNFSEWWYDIAIDTDRNGGYRYYTKSDWKNCKGYGTNEFGFAPDLLLFRNIQHSTYEQLTECEKSEYVPLDTLNKEQKTAWLDSIRLHTPHEEREEFFQTHWQRLNDLTSNPVIAAEMLVKNMKAFASEGLMYLESQSNPSGIKADGSQYTQEEVANIYRNRLAQEDAVATGVTVRLQFALLRFLPDAEAALENIYTFVAQNRDLYVGINMVGREDNPKGHPRRFLQTLRKMRRALPGVKLAIHAGESEAPNDHVRDTLLLGADRIGHGLNLIQDEDTLLFMRYNHFLVEINLVSNKLLGYVPDYKDHPFPEYLRIGIPVALSTDDRGMWDSNITDEFFVAVKEFNLSWDEILMLSRNSLHYSFIDFENKTRLLNTFNQRITDFESQQKSSTKGTSGKIETGQFLCQHYQLCEFK